MQNNQNSESERQNHSSSLLTALVTTASAAGATFGAVVSNLIYQWANHSRYIDHRFYTPLANFVNDNPNISTAGLILTSAAIGGTVGYLYARAVERIGNQN